MVKGLKARNEPSKVRFVRVRVVVICLFFFIQSFIFRWKFVVIYISNIVF